MSRKYPGEMREQTAAYYLESGKSMQTVAREIEMQKRDLANEQMKVEILKNVS